MSFSYIKDKITAIGPIYSGTEVAVNLNLTGSTELMAKLYDSFDLEEIVFKGYFADIADDYIHLTGFVDLLNRVDLEFDLLIRKQGDDYDLLLRLLIPGGWQFSESFGDLPALANGDPDNAEAYCLADTLLLSTSYLYFSSETGYNADAEMDLVTGLNFKGDVEFRGVWRLVGNLADIEWPLRLMGPVREYLPAGAGAAFTGLRLKAAVPLSIDLGSLGCSGATLYLKLPNRPTDYEVDGGLLSQPGLYFLMDTTIDGRPLQLISSYDPMVDSAVTLKGIFTDFAISGLGAMDSAVGGEGLAAAAPSELGSPSGLSLVRFEVCVDLATKAVSYLEVEVGCANTWELAPGWLTLTQVGLIFTVNNPFKSSGRSFEVGVRGWLEVAGATFNAMVTYPSLEFSIHELPGAPLSLGQLVEALAPGAGDMPAVNIDALHIEGDARTKSISLNLKASEVASFPIGSASCKLSTLGVWANYQPGSTTEGGFAARFVLGNAACTVGATFGNQTVFSGQLTDLSLHEIFKEVTGRDEVPEELPDVDFTLIGITYNHTTGAFRLTAEAELEYASLPFDSALSATLELEIERVVVSGQPDSYSMEVSIGGTGPVSFADGFSLEAFQLLFSYDTVAGWMLSGSFDTVICDERLTLSASYQSTPNGKKLSLIAIAPQEITLLSFPEVFSFAFSRLDLSVEAVAVEGKPDTRGWSLRLDSKLAIPNVATIAGMIQIYDDGNGKKGLRLRPTIQEPYSFSIADGVGMQFTPYEFTLTKGDPSDDPFAKTGEGQTNAPSTTTGWKFTGTVIMGITGVPGKIGQVLPSQMWAAITLGKGVARIEMYAPLQPWSFPLPKADGQPLGTIVLELRMIGIYLRPSVGIVAELGIGFPAELNTYFKRDVFRVYVPGDPMSMARIRVAVTTGGIELKFITSPFLSGTTNTVKNEDWLNFNFGEYGAIAMKLPSFRYDMRSTYFEASGGFKIERDLFLPLTPLRNFLDGVGMGAAKAIFPEKLPIKGMSLVDGNNNFKTEDLIALLGDIPSEAKSALRGAGNLLNRFPDSFKSYLRFEIPTALDFKFGFSPNGRVALSLLAPKEPIRFLYPGMVQGLVPMPGLIGIELRKLTVGTLASGTLFIGEVDGIIDFFDLPGLVASLTLPDDPSFPLPTSDQLQRRVLLRNVFSVIPLSQGVPVPVPVFYDEIGFEYKGIEGFGIGAHMGIPQPDFAAGGTALLQQLFQFFKDRNMRLDPKTPPGGQEIKFKFRDEYLEAPEYLGGGKVGTVGTTIEVGTWKYVASLMNFCKQFALNDIVGAIPIGNRSANKTASLGPFTVEGTYLITTTEEFDGGAYTELSLSQAQATDFKQVLPGVQIGQSNGTSGLIMFMRGAVKASSVFDLQASFGLAASDTMGFGTGFKLYGKLGSVVEAELRGALLLNAPSVANSPSYPAAQQVAAPALPAPAVYRRGDRKTLTLNGTNTYLEIAHTEYLKTDQFTLEAWVLVETITTGKVTIAGKVGGQWALNVLPQQRLEFTFKTKAGTVMSVTSEIDSYRYNLWQHFSISFDGTNARIFNSGHQIAILAYAGQLAADTTKIIVGREVSGTNPAFTKGRIAEIRLWKRARTGAEIKDELNTRLEGQEDSLVGYYPLDADNGTVAYDVCNGSHGKLFNPVFGNVDFLLMDGLVFDGLGDTISIPNFGDFVPADFTVEVLLRIAHDADDSFRGIIHSNGPIKLNTELKDDPTAAAKGLKKGKFYNVVLSTDSESSRVSVYVNGKQVNTYSGPTSTTPKSINIELGRSSVTTHGTFKGRIYEVRIWKTSWSSYTAGGNFLSYRSGNEGSLLALYRPSEAKGGVLKSVKGDRPGELKFLAGRKPVVLGGLRFGDGTQWGLLPMSSKYAPSSWTWEAWIRPELIDSTVRFLLRGLQCAPRIAWCSGSVSFRWYDGTGTFQMMDSPSGLARLNQWSHVALTHDGATARTYINGQLACERTGLQGLQYGPTEIVLGRREKDKTIENFVGRVDEIRGWSGARSQGDIQRYMGMELLGNEAGLIAYYRMDPLDGSKIVDLGPDKLHGTLSGLVTNDVTVTATDADRKRIQAFGHSRLKVGGHEVMVADMRVSDDEFWFKGKFSLFPSSSKFKVFGDAEALIKKDSLYLYAASQIKVDTVTLSKSRTLITHERVRLEGEWLGIHTLLDVTWANGNPSFKGAIWTEYSRTFEFGAIYIEGVRVCDNLRLKLDVGFDIGLEISNAGFKANVAAKFMIQGVGMNASFTLTVTPQDLDSIGNALRDYIAKRASTYFAHLFTSALQYVTAAYNATIEFAADQYAVVGNALNLGYRQTLQQAAQLWKNVSGNLSQVYSVVRYAYGVGMKEIGAALLKVGYVLQDVAQVFKDFANKVEDISLALCQIANVTVVQAITAMKAIGGTLHDVAKGIKNYVGENWNNFVSTLQSVYDPKEVSRLMRYTYNFTADQLASLYKSISFNLNLTYDAMMSAFGPVENVAKALYNALYTCTQVGEMLKVHYSVADTAAKILKAAGFSTNDITGVLKNVWFLTKSEAEKVIKTIESSASTVYNSIKNWFS